VFLAHYTASGIAEVENMYVDRFTEYLESAYKLYEMELEAVKPVAVTNL
jgi:hypothetical protein